MAAPTLTTRRRIMVAPRMSPRPAGIRNCFGLDVTRAKGAASARTRCPRAQDATRGLLFLPSAIASGELLPLTSAPALEDRPAKPRAGMTVPMAATAHVNKTLRRRPPRSARPEDPVRRCTELLSMVAGGG
mmetsp:Transcript_44339/g.96830  ORF Transcript_44339/g.96830 Transcript_44339/m.96830 type:complete len:131 (-) Transcript_44339:54-446(-)